MAPPPHPPIENDPPPATGAWMPGCPLGRRRLARVSHERGFRCEGGVVLPEVVAAYETWGTLDDDRSNAVLVCHALTGDSHAAGRAGEGHPTEGWWDQLIGPGRAIDTNRYFVVCTNVLGGCQGTTGPASIDPRTGRPYGSTFPVVTIRDMVRVQSLLAEHLRISSWHAVVGGSMGGMQVLEWATMFPDRVGAIVAIATAAAASAQQIAWSMVGRRSILLDPAFRGGDYYDAEPGGGPHAGLQLARQIAQIHYRSEAVFAERFGRRLLGNPADAGRFTLDQRFDVEGYLDYHGDKLVRRFDANSYLRLNKAMDLHDLGRGRGGIATAVGRIAVPAMIMSIGSDILYPPGQQEQLRDLLSSGPARARCGFYEIDSPDGHDGFLIEVQQISPIVEAFLD
ncbi:MAG: homoserine O-acetyltransferase, partial [Microthrixaceae bacterium]|nr:homoserine O-acetyltransferase [Microthrixaceae bacterium]